MFDHEITVTVAMGSTRLEKAMVFCMKGFGVLAFVSAICTAIWTIKGLV